MSAWPAINPLVTDSVAFDPTPHRYTVGGRVLPSVTQVLAAEGLMDASWFTDEARDRGTAVHAACALLDEGDLDWDSLDPRVVGFVRAYQEFLVRHRPRWEFVETPLGSASLGFAGTPDRAGMVHLPAAGSASRVLLDIKTGPPAQWHQVQLGGYDLLLAEAGIRVAAAATLHLRADGTFHMERSPSLADGRGVFRAVLTTHLWKGRNTK